MTTRNDIRKMRECDGLCDVDIYECNGYMIKIIADELPYGVSVDEWGWAIEQDFIPIDSGWGLSSVEEARKQAEAKANSLETYIPLEEWKW